MDTLFPKVAGLDVHLKTAQCAIRCQQESGKLLKQVRGAWSPGARSRFSAHASRDERLLQRARTKEAFEDANCTDRNAEIY
jgi:hypothetical protein